MKFFFFIFFVFAALSVSYSQSPDSSLSVNRDSVRILPKDSLAVSDTTRKKKSFDVDTVIYSSSKDSLFFHVNKKKMDLYGNSELKYKDTDLKSANIFIDFVTHDVDARGVPNDSLPGKFKDTPVLTQGSESYDGETMIYNFKTARGYITSASTKSDGTKYSGDKIKKVDKDTYFVKDGIFTTCTETPPHYYFFATEMKVIQKQEIDAQWIWLYFGGVPFPIPLPFGVFPLQSGRRSGIITPAFGQDGTKGYYFSHFGYFWAISDYYDLNLTSDYYTRGSYALNSRFRYNQRYDFGGSIEGGYKILNSEDVNTGTISQEKDWSISLNHQQNFTPTMRLAAQLRFLSGKNYVQNTTMDLNEALTNDVYSNATLTKTWDESGNSLSLSYSRSQDLTSGNISEVLPSLSFSIPQQYPFRRNGVTSNLKWYELVGLNYNGQFENERNKTNGTLSIRGGIEHQVAINASPKIGYFNITPSISYTEDWYNKQIQMYSAGRSKIDTTSDSVVTKDVHKLSAVRTFSLGVNASTKLYGMFQPNILGISAIRQIITPTIGYSFKPDFSKAGWGYYSSYTNSLGQKVIYDKYQNEILSQPSSGESQSINFSLGNVFEMKTAVDPSDTTAKEKKIQLLNLSAGISYNFAADSVKFSDISLTYRTQAGDWLSFQGSSSFSLYDWNANGANINKFLADEGKGLVRLKSFNFGVSTSLSADKFKSSEKDTTKNNLQSEAFIPSQTNTNKSIYNQGDPDFTIPWSLSLSYNYSFVNSTPTYTSRSSNVSASLDFNLTQQWKFSVAGSYDFMAKQFSAPQIRISRDLECWLMNFTWNPIGTYSGYYFEIRVKAPQLQDLKVTKRGDFYNDK